MVFKKYGITDPLSTENPTEEEIILSELIKKYLKNYFESEEEAVERERQLAKLAHVFQNYTKKYSPGELGELYTFGSYRLGVHSRGADIDTLCVGSSKISREMFFNEFYELLKEEKDVLSIKKIEGAYVPLISLNMKNIPIDLLYCRMPFYTKEITKNVILKGMDEKSVLSLNGVRIVDELLNLVPNKEIFHWALRCIKFWATKKYVYGNSYGYFGGVAFAISVARICQLYPNASIFTIVEKYFQLIPKWKWPSPLQLKEIEDVHYNFKVWNPKINIQDRYHKMPIITPSYPAMCATHNITHSTMSRFIAELEIAAEAIEKIKEGNKNEETFLDILLQPSPYFEQYGNFICIFLSGKRVDEMSEDIYKKEEGFLISRLRFLTNKLELIEEIESCPPFPVAIDLSSYREEKFLHNIKQDCDFLSLLIIGVEYSNLLMLDVNVVNISKPVEDFKTILESEFSNEEAKAMNIEVEFKTYQKKHMIDFMRTYNNLQVE